MRQPTPTVFAVDEDSGVRRSLSLLLKSLGYPAATFASAAQFLASYTDERPGCLLLDVRMPGVGGPELQRELNMSAPLLPVIVISGHADIPMAVEAMRCGAFDFLQKPFREQELLDRVQRALAADRENRARLRSHRLVRSRWSTLTRREREVLARVASGNSNKVIACHLGISPRTVEIHRSRILEKMHAESLAQLVRMSLMSARPCDTYPRFAA